MKYVIGVDLGTSGVKAILLSERGEVVDSRSKPYVPDMPGKGCVEQDPAVWWENTKAVIAELTRNNAEARGNIAALGCSGQMHSSVFLDAEGAVIRPALLWNDTRTTAQTKEIYERAGGARRVLDLAYNLALEGFTLPKILWLRENEPDNFKRLAKVIMPKDYINYMLTGVIQTDVSDAAGTLLFDVKNRCWSQGMLDIAGISATMLPEAVESTAHVGVPKPGLAAELGLSPGTMIIAGGADNSCAAIGNGVIGLGQGVISIGTSGTVVAFMEGVSAEATGAVHLFNYSYPGSCYAMGCMLSAGESLSWLRRGILAGMDYDELNALAANVPLGSNGLIFLPYLFGERCPHTDANARGVFFGLSGTTDRGAMARAVMEGVAFGLRDMLELVLGFAPMNDIYITGGGAKSDLWGQIIADVLGRELNVLDSGEGPAMGAALIGAVGAGVFRDFKEARDKTVSIARVITPNAANTRAYEPYYGIFRKLYTANKELFAELASVIA